MSDYSFDALTGFLDYGASKGLLNKATASAKKIAVERVFEVADDAEREDVRTVDIGHLMARFINLAGSGFRPESLASYQSRVKSAIEEFVAWKQNPMGFRANKRGSVKKKAKAPSVATKPTAVSPAPAVLGTIQPKPATLSLPIPIRADLTVQIDGIPFDLTKAEASKIANVVLAMAGEIKS
jgi:hypothetical protein